MRDRIFDSSTLLKEKTALNALKKASNQTTIPSNGHHFPMESNSFDLTHDSISKNMKKQEILNQPFIKNRAAMGGFPLYFYSHIGEIPGAAKESSLVKNKLLEIERQKTKDEDTSYEIRL